MDLPPRLIDQARRGDQGAFESIVRCYEHSALTTAFRIVGQQNDAEDVRQTVFVKLWKAPSRMPIEGFEAWLKRCVINESITYLRKRKRERKRDIAAQQSNTVTNDALQSEELEMLQNAMESLAPELRAIVSLRFDDRLTIREMASVLQQSPSTVQSKLQRCLSVLRSAMQSGSVQRLES